MFSEIKEQIHTHGFFCHILNPQITPVLKRAFISVHFHTEMKEVCEAKVFPGKGEDLKLLICHYVSVH